MGVYQHEMGIKNSSQIYRRAEKVIVLMDSSKFGRKSSFTICDLKDVDVVVSDEELPESFLELCRENHVMIR